MFTIPQSIVLDPDVLGGILGLEANIISQVRLRPAGQTSYVDIMERKSNSAPVYYRVPVILDLNSRRVSNG